jgi:hypothetical protein
MSILPRTTTTKRKEKEDEDELFHEGNGDKKSKRKTLSVVETLEISHTALSIRVHVYRCLLSGKSSSIGDSSIVGFLVGVWSVWCASITPTDFCRCL